MHDKHQQPEFGETKFPQLGEFGAIPGAPNGPPAAPTDPQAVLAFVNGLFLDSKDWPRAGGANPPPTANCPPPTAFRLPSFFPVRDLTLFSSVDADWIWDGYLARQALTLFVSEPKAGKSTLIFGLMQRMLSGEPFLGRTTNGIGTIYFSEEPLATLREKAERFSLPIHGERIQFVSRRQSPNQTLDLQAALDGAVEKARAIGAGLIVIDTLSAWCGLKAEEENSAAACESMMARFRDAAVRSNAAMLLVHHTRKDGKYVRGSTALTGSADIVLKLERNPFLPLRRGDRATEAGQEAPAILRVRSRYSNSPDPLYFVLNADGYAVVGVKTDVIRKHAAIYDLLPNQPPGKTRDELSKATGLSRWKMYCAVRELIAAGAAVSSGSGASTDPERLVRLD
jgi:hypothetical protein